MAVMDAASEEPDSETKIADRLHGFKKLIKELKRPRAKYDDMSAISAIQQALTLSHCEMTQQYESKMAEFIENEFPCQGTLYIAGVCIARGSGYNKKITKNSTYKKAMNYLTTKPIEDVIEGLPEGEEDDADEWNVRVRKESALQEVPQSGLKKKLDDLLNTVQSSMPSKNIIKTLDFISVFKGFTPTCVFRRDAPAEGEEGAEQVSSIVTCELYLDAIFIACGEGETKEDSEQNAYTSSWQVLCTVSSGLIRKFHKCLTVDERTHPTVFDIAEKGSAASATSNILQLRQSGADVHEEWKIPSALVVIENEMWAKNRLRNSYSIMSYSASQNGMLCQWNIQPFPEDKKFK